MNQEYLSTKPQDYESNSQEKVNDISRERAAWSRQAERLAQWAMERMVVRPDVYLGYYAKASGEVATAKRDGQVTLGLLKSHFAVVETGSLVGLYTTSLKDECRWMVVDLDRHDGDSEEIATRNLEFARLVFDRLVGMGFHPLLIDSNGRGGFHLVTVCGQSIPARHLRSFGRWLVRDWQDFSLASEPEVFPAQDSINGGYGNAVRLPGLHHTYQHYSRVWDGKEWASGEKAVEMIVATSGDPIGLIPEQAKEYQPPKSAEPNDWWKKYDGDLRTLDIVGLFRSKAMAVQDAGGRQYEVACPWADHIQRAARPPESCSPTRKKVYFRPTIASTPIAVTAPSRICWNSSAKMQYISTAAGNSALAISPAPRYFPQ